MIGMLSRAEFQMTLSKFKLQCDKAVKTAAQDLFRAYGLDVHQLDHSDESQSRMKASQSLSTLLNDEIQMYCADIWDEFAKGKPDMAYPGACTINRICAQQYVGKSQSCMVMSGRLIGPCQALRS